MHSTHGTKLGMYCTYSMFLNNFCISLHSVTSDRTVTPFEIWWCTISTPHRHLHQLIHIQPIPLPGGHFSLYHFSYLNFFFFRFSFPAILSANDLTNLALVMYSASPPCHLNLGSFCARNAFFWHRSIMKPNFLIYQSLGTNISSK